MKFILDQSNSIKINLDDIEIYTKVTRYDIN